MHKRRDGKRMDLMALAPVNILTFVSLVFALWINFAVVFMNDDMLNHKVKDMSLKDPLTGLPNRRMINQKLEEFLHLHEREKMNFSVVLFDLDDFKKVNDCWGRTSGDEGLVDFSRFLQLELTDTKRVCF